MLLVEFQPSESSSGVSVENIRVIKFHRSILNKFVAKNRRGKIHYHFPFFFFCFRRRYPTLPSRNSRRSYPCAPVDMSSLDVFGSAIACALKIMSMKSDDSETRLAGHVPAPTYVKVSAPLLYKPLPRTSSLVYIAPPIVKSASAIVATEPKTMEKDAQYMVNNIFRSLYETQYTYYTSILCFWSTLANLLCTLFHSTNCISLAYKILKPTDAITVK